MKRYSIQSWDAYDVEEDPAGSWVYVDDAEAAIAKAVAEERAKWARVAQLAKQCADKVALEGDGWFKVADELLTLLQLPKDAA